MEVFELMLLTCCLTFLKKTVEMHLKLVSISWSKNLKGSLGFSDESCTLVLCDLNRLDPCRFFTATSRADHKFSGNFSHLKQRNYHGHFQCLKPFSEYFQRFFELSRKGVSFDFFEILQRF